MSTRLELTEQEWRQVVDSLGRLGTVHIALDQPLPAGLADLVTRLERAGEILGWSA